MSDNSPSKSGDKNDKNKNISFIRKQLYRPIRFITHADVYEIVTWFVAALTIGFFILFIALTSWLGCIITGTLLIGEAVFVVHLKRKQQNPSNQTQLDEIKRLLVSKPKPSLLITEALLDNTINSGDFPLARLKAVNKGDATAHNVRLNIVRAFLDDRLREQARKGYFPKDRHTPSFASIGPVGKDEPIYFESPPGQWNNSLERPIILQEGRIWHVWGDICYDNGEGTNFVSRFCYQAADPDSKVLRVAETHNEIYEGDCPAHASDPRDKPPLQGQPEISIDMIALVENTTPPQVAIQIRNAGNASAYSCNIAHWGYHRPTDEANQQAPTPLDDGDVQTLPKMAQDTIYSAFLTILVAPATWQRVLTGELELLTLLKVRYADENGREFGFDRCYRLDVQRRRLMLLPNELWPVGFSAPG